ncbi:hypothetical protein [Brevibacillus laterosporus]|uniref:hypothetical protein n=1 Tax=Brevibacillus laterosporus TaxID=1465 RepID=UPI0018F86F20|nr:hypothetical protein [Brevibacillus laterosporus]MBG9775875.1 hypothetical protein [Brevibacillus laterosporus]
MRFKLFTPILFFILFGFLLGCQDDKLKDQNKETVLEDTKIPNKESKATKDKKVKWVKVLESPKNISSPSEAVIHQYEVTFKDGKKEFPKKDSVIFETTLGGSSIVAIHSPEGENNYAIFLYEYNSSNKWIINGLLRLLGGRGFTDKEGLDLPMNKFNALNLTISEKNKKIWTFADEKEIVTITVSNRVPFVEHSDPKKISLSNGNEAYISKDHLKNSYLYYFDTGKTIVVSGNVSKQNIINLANSLPSVNSAFFPSPEVD